MSVEVEDFSDIATVGQGQHHGAAGFSAEHGRGRASKASGCHPIGLRSAKRQINPQGVLELEPVGQAIGWQWRRGWQGSVTERWLPGSNQPGDGAGFLAIMQQDG
jgi:hypothetical protein